MSKVYASTFGLRKFISQLPDTFKTIFAARRQRSRPTLAHTLPNNLIPVYTTTNQNKSQMNMFTNATTSPAVKNKSNHWMNRVLTVLIALLFTLGAFAQTTYYSKAGATQFANTASWGTNTDGSGAAPGSISSADNYIIQNSSILTLNADATVRSLTINAGRLNVAANTLNVGITGQKNSTLTLALTTSVLNVSGGTINIDGALVVGTTSISPTFTQTGGNINIDGNNGGSTTNSYAGTALCYLGGTASTLSLTGGTLTIVDPPAGATYAFYGYCNTAVNFGTGHTIRFGDGASNDAGTLTTGFYVSTFPGSSYMQFGNVELLSTASPAANRFVSNLYTITALGNMTIGTNAEIRQIATSYSIYIAGNLTNNGTFTSIAGTSPVYFGSFLNATAQPSTTAQTISGSGVFRNNTVSASSTANFVSVTINNISTSGVTFSNANSLLTTTGGVTNTGTASGTLTFVAGTANLNSGTFILGVNTTTLGTSSWTAGGFSNGSFKRFFSATATTGAGAMPTTLSSTTPVFPFFANGANRHVYLARSASWTTAGSITATHTATLGLNTVSFSDGAYTVQRQTAANWSFSSGDGINVGATTLSLGLNGDGTMITAAAPGTNIPRLVQASAAVATHVAGTGTAAAPIANRSTLSLANLTAASHYIGIATADLNSTTVYSVATGNWGTASTWSTGTVPNLSTTDVIISAGTTVTVDATTNAGSAVAANTININGSGSLVVSANTLNITATTAGTGLLVNSLFGSAIVSGGTINVGTGATRVSTFSFAGTLTVSSGNLNINGNFIAANNSTFNQSGGTISIDGNQGGTAGVASGTALCAINSYLLNLTGGILQIVDPHALGTTNSTGYALTYNNANNVNIGTGHTIQFGNGVSTDAGNSTGAYGFSINSFLGSGRIAWGAVSISEPASAPGANRKIIQVTSNMGIQGNLTLTGVSEYDLNSNVLHLGGNLSVGTGATFSNTGTLALQNFLNGIAVAVSGTQSISGAGTFRNSRTTVTGNFAGFIVNNVSSGGVTLNVPLSVTGTLTMTAGLINTTTANILQLGTTTGTPAAGTLSGTAGVTNMIVGPFARVFTASRTAAGTYTNTTLYPVGKGSSYNSVFVDPSTSATGAVIISAEAFTSNSGSGASGVSNFSTTARWEVLTTSGFANLTNAFARVQESGITSAFSILQAPSAAGTYASITGVNSTYTAGPPPSLTTATAIPAATLTSNGYFAYGQLTACVAPVDQPTSLLPTPASTSITATFTAAASTPTGYLVVRYAAGGTVTLPATGIIYTAGGSLGTGTIVSSGTTTSFSVTGLTSSTAYDFYVYSYNNTACSGIAYNTTSPLFSTISTCVNAPVANAATSPLANGFTANWATVAGATGYALDVSLSNTFATFVPGYSNLSVGNVLTYAVTGLSSGQTYYYRVRGTTSSCSSSSSNTITASTLYSLPFIQNFGTSTFPTGWTANAASPAWAPATSNDGVAGPYSTNTNFLGKLYSTSDAYVYSPRIDLSTLGTNLAKLYLFVYRSTVNFSSDVVRVKINSTASETGATTLLTIFPLTTVAPTVAAAGWYEYSVDIPVGFNTNSAYVMIEGQTSGGFSSYGLGVSNLRVLAPCSAPVSPTALTPGVPGPGTLPLTFTPNATAPNGYMVVRYATGATGVTAPANGSSFTLNQVLADGGIVSNILSGAASSFTISGLSPNTGYDVYVYPYNITNCVGGPTFGAALSGTNISTSGCPTLTSTITVGASGADYTTLGGAINVLNGCAITVPTIVKLNADYAPAGETYPIVVNSNSGASATNTITIVPDAAVTTPFTLTGSSASTLIDFVGAKYYTIDGRPGGTGTTSQLNITNTGTGSAVRFYFDAQNNNLQYLGLKASAPSSTDGVVSILNALGTTATNGNNNITIANNNIDGNGASVNGIYAAGSAAPADNKSVSITNNNIFNYFSDVASTRNSGIQISSNNAVTAGGAWTISGNSFYQTVTRTYANLTGVHGINADGANGGVYTISNNNIGGTATAAGGSPMTLAGTATYVFSGFRLFPASSATTTISGNTIKNISITTASTSATLNSGMSINAGQVAVSNNTIGSTTTAGSIAVSSGAAGGFTGINLLASSTSTGTTFGITNNTIAGISLSGANASSFTGINTSSLTPLSGVLTITGNNIGSATAAVTNSTTGSLTGITQANAAVANINSNTITNFASTNTTTSTSLIGINISSGTATSTINSNTIKSFTSTATNTSSTSGAALTGIQNTGTQASITGNTISGLTASTATTTAAVSVHGIYNSATVTVVNRNLIYDLSATASASAVINGIYIGSGTTQYSNNLVRLGTVNPAIASTINGINDAGGTNNLYFNSLYIGGSAVGTTASNTYALYSTNTTSKVIQNNVLQNARSNASTGGKHYGIRIASTTGLTLNYNDYFVNGANGAVFASNAGTDVISLAAWKTATSQDANSYNADPNFNNPTAAIPDFSINAALASVLEGNATPVAGITVDYSGNTRNVTKPDIGAYEFTGISAVPVINSVTASAFACTATSHTVTVLTTDGSVPVTAGMLTLNYSFNGTAQTPITTFAGGSGTWTATLPAATPANATVTWSVTLNDGNFTVNKAGADYTDEPLNGVTATATASVNPICAGSATVLTASIPNQSVYTNSFETGITGFVSGTVSGTPSLTQNTTYSSNGTASMYLNTASSSADVSASSGANINLSGAAGAVLTFSHIAAMEGSSTDYDYGYVQYSSNGGTTWTSFPTSSYAGTGTLFNSAVSFSTRSYANWISAFTSSSSTPTNALWQNETINIPAAALTSQFRLRFRYTTDGSTNYFGWLIDNVKISVPVSITSVVWNNSAGTNNPQTINPTSSATYSANLIALGCSITTNSVSLTVNPTPPTPNAFPAAQCGTGLPTAFVSSTGNAGNPIFVWYTVPTGGTAFQTGESNTNTTLPINTTTTFYVSETNGTCESARVPLLCTVNTPPAVNIAAAGPVCLGSSFNLAATSPNDPNYSYTWTNITPSLNRSGLTNGTTGATVNSVTPDSAAAFTYQVSAVDATTGNPFSGCATSSQVTVLVNKLPVINTPTANPSTVCAGANVVLTATAPSPVLSVLGTGTTTTSGQGITPFGSNYEGSRTQYLVRASELQAIGLTAGDINSLAFDVSAAGAGTFAQSGFTIKIATTAQTALTTTYGTPVGSFSTVFGPATVAAPAVGIRTFTFSSPYNWDGTSNILIDICHDNDISATCSSCYSSNSTVKYTATTYNSVYGSYADNAPSCGVIASSTISTYTNRPNMIFGTGTVNFTWNNGAPAGSPVTVNPLSTTTYEVTGTNPLTTCFSKATVEVTVNAVPTVPEGHNSAQCGNIIPTAYVTSTSGAATPSFIWYDAASGGTVKQTGTSATYLTAISTATTFYVSEVSAAGCESSPRVAVFADVSTPDLITASVSAVDNKICFGGTTQISAAYTPDFNNYTSFILSVVTEPGSEGSGITSPVTLTLAEGGTAPYTITPTAPGTYHYVITATEDGGCTTTSTVELVVAPAPSAITAAASLTTVCAGSTVNLTATSPETQNITATAINEGFEVFPPASWTFINAGSGNTWGTSTAYTHGGTKAMGYSYSSSSAANAWAITPAQTLVAGKTYTLKFWYSTSYGSYYPERLKVTVGSLATVAGQTTTLWNNNGGSSLTNESYVQATITYVPATSGTYYFGFNCYSSANQDELYIDDITLTYPDVLEPNTYAWTSDPAGFTSTDKNPTNVTVAATTQYIVKATNSQGCESEPATVTVTANPIPGAPVTAATASRCGPGVVNLTATGAGGDFNWYNVSTGGTSLFTGGTYPATVAASSSLWVAETSAAGCTGPRSEVAITITTAPVLEITATGATTFCQGGSVALSTAPSSDASYVNFTWSATPVSGSGLSATNVASVTANPTASGTIVYKVTADDGLPGGCSNTATKTITVNPNPVIITPVATPASTCAGGSVNLFASTSEIGAGTAALGTGTTTTSGNGITPYTSNYEGARVQYLVRASELTAIGLQAGSITSLAFDVTAAGSGAFAQSNFSIKIAKTAQTALSTAYGTPVGTFTTVLNPTTVAAPSVGINTFTFDNPFVWDGTSNILIDICHDNDPSATCSSCYSGNSTVKYSTTSFNSVYGRYADDAQSCGATTQGSSISTYTNRPNMQFGGTVALTGAGTYSWSWTPGGLTGNSVTVTPTGNTSYFVTATNPSTNCTTTTTVPLDVTIVPLAATASASPLAICPGGSTTITAVATGGGPFTYLWDDAAASTTASISVSPAATTTYHVTVKDACGNPLVAEATVTVNAVPTSSIVEENTTLCSPASVTLTASTDAASPVYQWLLNNNNIAGATSATYTINSVSTGAYKVEVTDGVTNCKGLSNARFITINQTPSDITIAPVSATICNGSSVSLTATGGTVGGGGDAVIGAGATTISGTTTGQGNPFNHYYGGLKQQVIYTKTELNAAGITGGNISALALQLSALGSSTLTMSNFTINMGHTSQAAATTTLITSGLTQVYANASQGVTLGANTYTFSSPFNWNNTDNLVVSISWSNVNSGSSVSSPTIVGDVAGFTATSYIWADNTSAASLITASSNTSSGVGTTSQTATTSNRPKITFTYNSLQPAVFTWGPATGLNTTSGATVIASPTTTTTYTVTSTSAAGCPKAKTVEITVTPLTTITVAAAPLSQTVLVNDPSPTPLTVTATGTAPITYQWYSNTVNNNTTGTSLGAGAQTSSYTPLTSASGTTYYYVVVTGGCGTATSAVVSVTVSNANSWKQGNPTTNWSTPSNWSTNQVPNAATDAVIPNGNIPYPVLTTSSAVMNLTIDPGATVGIASNTLTINGTVTGTGTLTGSETSNLVMTSPAATVRFTPGTGTNTLKGLTISSGTTTLGNTLNITGGTALNTYGTVTVANGASLASNGNLNIKSNQFGTARVAANTSGSNYITGDVTVERYIPQNSSRAWRLLSVPTKGTKTIKQTWQENQAPGVNGLPGFGTQITANLATLPIIQAAGFDAFSQSGSSMSYNSGTQAWTYLTSTNSAPIETNKGYFLYIRGSRAVGVSTSTGTVDATVLRTTGTLYQGDNNTAISVAAGKFEPVGNTFASAIDFTSLSKTGVLTNSIYVWDSKLVSGGQLGAYQTFVGALGFKPATPGGSYPDGVPNTTIESGQAIMVGAPAGGGGTIKLVEAAKTTGNQLNPFRPASLPAQFKTSLVKVNGNTNTFADNNIGVFDQAFSNAVDGDDAAKIMHSGENISIIRSNTKLLVEARQPVMSTDTLFFYMEGVQSGQQYKFEFSNSNLPVAGLTAFVEDKFLNTSTAIDLAAAIHSHTFTVDASSGSAAADRFRIVFKQTGGGPLPVSFINVSANRAIGGGVQVQWTVAGERGIRNYEVESSADGRNFRSVGTVTANGQLSYGLLDAVASTGISYYRIKSIGAAGEVRYSTIVKVDMSNVKPSISISPNPVEGSVVNLQFKNQPKGRYNIRLLSNLGQAVFTSVAEHAGGTSTQVLNLPTEIARGSYQLEVIFPDKTRQVQTLFINTTK